MSSIEREMRYLVRPQGVCPGISIAYGNKVTSITKQIGSDGAGNLLDETTLFDLASITKFFLALIYLKLSELNIIDLEASIGMYTNAFNKISHLKIKHMLSYNVDLYTPQRIDAYDNYEDAYRVLQLVEGQYSEVQRYSDIPAIILAEVLFYTTGKTYGEWVYEIIVNPLHLETTGWDDNFFKDKKICSYANEMWLFDDKVIVKNNPIGIVNDPKARILSNNSKILCGHAGLFTSTKDIIKILQEILNERIIQKESLFLLAQGSGWDLSGKNQSFGFQCYRKINDDRQTEVPLFLSDRAIASSGYTGCYLVIDPINDIFAFVGGNRLNNSICKNMSSIKVSTEYFEASQKKYRTSLNYVYDRDKLRDVLCNSALLLKNL